MNILVVGGGIASCHIIHSLLEHTCRITFISDPDAEKNSSRMAGASIVPVNIRKGGADYYAPAEFGAVVKQYAKIESVLQKRFLHRRPLKVFCPEAPPDIFSDQYTAYPDSFFLNVRALLSDSHSYFADRTRMISECFDHQALVLTKDKALYKGQSFDRVLFCEGTGVINNPFFKALRFNENWGQALILSLKNVDRQFMYHHRHRLLPIENDLWWYGASQVWQPPDKRTQMAWRETQRQYLYEWTGQEAGIISEIVYPRPTTPGQFPYIGRHPHFPHLYIMNGLGSRGMMQSARYAPGLVQAVLSDTTLQDGYDYTRFLRLFT